MCRKPCLGETVDWRSCEQSLKVDKKVLVINVIFSILHVLLRNLKLQFLTIITKINSQALRFNHLCAQNQDMDPVCLCMCARGAWGHACLCTCACMCVCVLLFVLIVTVCKAHNQRNS